MDFKEYLTGKGLNIMKDEINATRPVHVRINDTFNTVLPWKLNDDGTSTIPREEFFRLLGGHMLMHQSIVSGWSSELEYDLIHLTSVGVLQFTPPLYFEFADVNAVMYEEEEQPSPENEVNESNVEITTLNGSIYNKEEETK